VALGGTAQFAVTRVAPGPKTAREITTMTLTSLVIPELACWHWLRGRIGAQGARPWPRVRAVLFDRDGTLIRDVPYNGDPSLVEPLPGAAEAVRAARRRGLAVAMVTNQSGIARGLLSRSDAEAVNARVGQLLGPFDAVRLCPHGDDEGCGCRKPAPGMVLSAAAELGLSPHECVVIGDIGADVAAARAAGARGVLVPTAQTSPAERAGVRVAADLAEAVDMITGELAWRRYGAMTSTGRHGLAVRLDNAGDVLLAGPAVRAMAASCDRVTMLAGPHGAAAARLLPGVDDVVVWRAPWVDLNPPPVRREMLAELSARLAAERCTEAVIFSSFHQSPLPTALILRLAGIERIAALSEDYPGSLLDVRHRGDADIPEAERALGIARAAGFELPPGDDGKLAVRRPLPDVSGLTGSGPYVVLHPGASAPARRWPARRWAEAAALLADREQHVILTGGASERDLTGTVAVVAAAYRRAPGGQVTDLGGRTSIAELAAVLAGADAVLVANTGVAHLAAAVRRPIVSLFAPVVPAARWAPYGVPVTLLGDQHAPCRHSRAVHCPVPGHPCLTGVSAEAACRALDELRAWEAA
jgi:HAD superfamily hydrolase (TIGR01662 family)